MKRYRYFSMPACAFLSMLVLALTGCATPIKTPVCAPDAIERELHKQRCLALEERLAYQQRLADVSFRILRGATGLTSRQRKIYGCAFAQISSFTTEYQQAAAEVYRLGKTPIIVCITQGSPAEAAGLAAGDEVLEIDGDPLPEDSKRWRTFLQEKSKDDLVSFLIRRKNEKLTLSMKPVPGADFDVRLIDSHHLIACADGEKVSISKGMMRFAADDPELAMVISHEVAHNIRGHSGAMRWNALAGGFLGALVDVGIATAGVYTGAEFLKRGLHTGQQVYSKDMEREADYIGLYILARSDYDIRLGPNILRKLGASRPRSIERKYANSHPSTSERFVMLEKTIEEIERKQGAGISLQPEQG